MSSYEPSSDFTSAAAFLSHAPSLAGLSNNVKLELYGLFKTVTVDPVPNTSRPSLFDFAGRAKWDSWKSVGAQYPDQQKAEERYIELAKGLGWVPGAVPQVEETPKEDPDDIWDSDETSRARSGGGMGNRVSTMQHEEDSTSNRTLHALAVTGDVYGLQTLLDANPEAEINERDDNGYTPLHLACDRGHLTVVRLLLDRGADPSIKDADDYTAIELAEIAEHDDVISLLKSMSA